MNGIGFEMHRGGFGQLWAWLSGPVAEWAVGPPDRLADELVGDVDRDLDDMQLITRHEAGPAALLPERLTSLGCDYADLDRRRPDLVRRLEANCRGCPFWRRCARDLGRSATEPDTYCCNAALLRGRD